MRAPIPEGNRTNRADVERTPGDRLNEGVTFKVAREGPERQLDKMERAARHSIAGQAR